jgi:fatty-acyl-CoA synthase
MIIGKVLAKRAMVSPDREALIFNDRVFTFRELNHRSNQLAHGLLSLGISSGDRVGLLMHNSNPFLETYFALSKIGAVLVPLNTRLSVPELDFILDDCDVRLFIYGEAFSADVARMAFSQKGRVMISTSASPPPGTLVYEELIALNRGEEPDFPIDEKDLNVIMYTSGTTGHPKGAMLTHRGMYSGAVDMLIGLHYQYPDRCLLLGPFFHSGSITPFLGHVIKGISTVIVEKFDARKALELIGRYEIGMMLGVTTIMKMIMEVPDIASYPTPAWKYAILPGSPLPGTMVREAYERMGVLCQNLWGMTELSGPGSFMNLEDILRKPESAGKPYFNVDLKILEYDGSELPAGQVGEIVVRAPHVMEGYWNRPEATAETLRNGWLHSGDLGYLDDEGFIYVVDRKKDMLISGGENVYPAEIERVIREIPGIGDVSIIDIPDDTWGQVPKAFIEIQPGYPISARAVIDHCRSKLAGYKVPKQVEFIEQLPRTPSGKVLKRKLRDL